MNTIPFYDMKTPVQRIFCFWVVLLRLFGMFCHRIFGFPTRAHCRLPFPKVCSTAIGRGILWAMIVAILLPSAWMPSAVADFSHVQRRINSPERARAIEQMRIEEAQTEGQEGGIPLRGADAAPLPATQSATDKTAFPKPLPGKIGQSFQ